MAWRYAREMTELAKTFAWAATIDIQPFAASRP